MQSEEEETELPVLRASCAKLGTGRCALVCSSESIVFILSLPFRCIQGDDSIAQLRLVQSRICVSTNLEKILGLPEYFLSV